MVKGFAWIWHQWHSSREQFGFQCLAQGYLDMLTRGPGDWPLILRLWTTHCLLSTCIRWNKTAHRLSKCQLIWGIFLNTLLFRNSHPVSTVSTNKSLKTIFWHQARLQHRATRWSNNPGPLGYVVLQCNRSNYQNQLTCSKPFWAPGNLKFLLSFWACDFDCAVTMCCPVYEDSPMGPPTLSKVSKLLQSQKRSHLRIIIIIMIIHFIFIAL